MLKLTKIIFAALLAVAADALIPPSSYTFERFELDFGKRYATRTERDNRKSQFTRRLRQVLEHNARSDATYKKGINSMSDLSDEERRGFPGFGVDTSMLHFQKHRRPAFLSSTHKTSQKLPESIDWRTKGVVTPVKNQGQCGSCWTFASAEAIESHWAIQTGNLEELSEQFILDCTPNPEECGGQGGCNGGTSELAFNQLKRLGGIPSEWTYPYVSARGDASICHGLPLGRAAPHQASVAAAANVTGFKAAETNNCDDLLAAVATKGPLVVSVDAGAWHDYESGIFNGGNISNPTLNHAVLLVGYGEEDGKGYWILRNSWTPQWGEHGYIRIARQVNGEPETCGQDLNPADGNGCRGGPPTVKVCGHNGICYDGTYPLVR